MVELEEAELGRLADDQAELLRRQLDLGAFLHAERHDAQRLDRRAHAGHRGHRGLDADVVGAGGAAADAHAAAAPRQAVVRRAARDGVFEVAAARARARRPRAGAEPAVEHVDQALRAARSARMTPPLNSTAVGRGAITARRRRLAAEEVRQVAGDGRVGGVRQAELLQAGAPLRLRPVAELRSAGRSRRPASRSTSARSTSVRSAAADHLAAAAEDRDRHACRRCRRSSSRSLASRQLATQAAQLPRRRAACRSAASRSRTLIGEREVHVVAAEQDVVADGDALERQLAALLAHGDQGEVGGAAADVADQDDVADRELPARQRVAVWRRSRRRTRPAAPRAASPAAARRRARPARSARARPRRTTPARSGGRPARRAARRGTRRSTRARMWAR